MSDIITKNTLLMPKATAVWLIEKTALSFEQIADFTNLHALEVQALADGEVGYGIVGRDPILNNETTQEEIEKAEKDPEYRIKLSARKDLPALRTRSKGPRYTPVTKRGDKPDAIAWLLKHHPEITDAQIVKLIGTTKTTINAIRDRTHANITNIRPRSPVDLSLCTYTELDQASRKGLKAQGKDPDEVMRQRKEAEEAERQKEKEEDNSGDSDVFSGFDFSNFIKAN